MQPSQRIAIEIASAISSFCLWLNAPSVPAAWTRSRKALSGAPPSLCRLREWAT